MRKATDQRDAQWFLCCERAFWRSMVVMFCAEVKCFDVLMSVAGSGHVMVKSFDAMWWLVLCHVTWSNAMSRWWAVLLQYYSVLQSTTPIPPWTTKYYSSTTLYYKVLLQYYSVLQILLCTTKYYSSTTVLLQYYSVLQSTTPVLLRTKYYSSTTLYYKVLLQHYSVLQSTAPVLQRTTPVLQRSTLYYKVLLQYYSCTTKYYSSTTLYYKVLLHQILHLPPKITVISDPRHIWNVISNAQSSQSHPATSANIVPATQNECHDWSCSRMKRHLQCAEQQASPSNLTKYCACHAKWISWLIRITYETSFTMRGATGINLQPHQILRLPSKRNVMIDPHHIWNVIYNARSDRHHLATSPNTAPATQNCTPKS